MLIPIRTETAIRHTPLANFILIGLNVVCYVALDGMAVAGAGDSLKDRFFTLHGFDPSLYQFFTYQFAHADIYHLLGNMLFLWVFGNGVNGKMGDVPYVLFYLAGGVLAGWGYALYAPADLIGASGAIAAVTAAYLALYPRSRVTVLYLLFFIGTFEVPAMVLILAKVILWDNVIAPQMHGSGNVATEAHLIGYAFGLAATAAMLWWRVLPRDQFDMVALIKRWNQRREFQQVMADPDARARAAYGAVGRAQPVDPRLRAAADAHLDRISDLRARIGECLEAGDVGSAATLYAQLVDLDRHQVLHQRAQMGIAREFYNADRYAQAAEAFEKYLAGYARGAERAEIALLLGILYARNLGRLEEAEKHLELARNSLAEPSRQEQCDQWLSQVNAALGKN